jgi:hypothetical protein
LARLRGWNYLTLEQFAMKKFDSFDLYQLPLAAFACSRVARLFADMEPLRDWRHQGAVGVIEIAKGMLICGRHLCMIDDDGVEGTFGWLQFKA